LNRDGGLTVFFNAQRFVGSVEFDLRAGLLNGAFLLPLGIEQSFLSRASFSRALARFGFCWCMVSNSLAPYPTGVFSPKPSQAKARPNASVSQ
jgi:hypothetical protein